MRICSWKDGELENKLNQVVIFAINSRLRNRCKKTADLIEKLILQSSQPGDTVLDPFVGAGTTCLAAKKLGRKFVGIELDDAYCDLAAARINGNPKSSKS